MVRSFVCLFVSLTWVMVELLVGFALSRLQLPKSQKAKTGAKADCLLQRAGEQGKKKTKKNGRITYGENIS